VGTCEVCVSHRIFRRWSLQLWAITISFHMTYAIDTRQLRKTFGETVAVTNLTLQVERGEVFGFLGPNGAGKTTSVKMLLGLITPTAGSGELLGQPLGSREARAKTGYLPEHFRFYDWLTASEFLHLHGQLYGMDANQRNKTIPDLLALVGLSEQANIRVGAFSKGMTQRIGLAQALLNDPELVFLDEPTSGLDPIGRRLVRDIIMHLQEEGVAVFLNSHLLSEVELTCDRVAFIRNGVVVESASMEELNRQNVRVTLRVGDANPNLLQGLAQFGSVVPRRGKERVNAPLLLDVGSEERLPALTRWLVENEYPVYEISPSRLTLEDRFIQIMEQP